MGDSHPLTTVIICSYNRAAMLGRALHSLAAQSPGTRPFEVLVVDDGSDDDTPRVCQDLRTKMPNLRCVSTGANRGLGSARNFGVKAAVGEYILFMDDDCIADDHWVARMQAMLRREPIVAGAVATSAENFVRLCHNIAQFYGYMPTRKSGRVPFLAGANMGFRRAVLEELRGFREDVRNGEDMEFSIRACAHGYGPHFAPDAVVTHDPDRSSIVGIFRYSADHAATTIRLRNANRTLLRTPPGFRSPAFLVVAAPFIALAVTLRIYLSSRAIARFFWTAPVVYGLKVAWCLGAARGLRNSATARLSDGQRAGRLTE